MLQNIKIKVNGQNLTCDNIKTASDVVNDIQCDFNLSAEWLEFSDIYAIFESKTKCVEQRLSDSSCLIPSLCLAERGPIKVNLVARKSLEDSTRQLTSYKAVVAEVTQSVNTTGENDVAPPIPVWQQALESRLTDAPSDGNQYLRKNGEWSEVEFPGYEDLANKPKINGVEISGDLSSEELGISKIEHRHLTSDITNFPNLSTVALTGSYNDLSDKPNYYTKPSDGIPESDLSASVQTSLNKADTSIQSHQDISHKQDKATLAQDVESEGFTKNSGTITGIKMNGEIKGVQGEVDLGTVLTQHQDLSSYAKKSDIPSPYDDTALVRRVSSIESKESAWDSKADGNHNHAGVYQPVGDYASSSHTHSYSTLTDKPTIPEAYNDSALKARISAIESKESSWDSKQDAITDINAIRSGAAAGATALQELPEHIHTDEEITMSDFGVNLRGFAQSALSDVNDLSDAVDDLNSAVSDMNTILGGKLSDAPSDGKQYSRRNGAWEITSAGSSDYSSLAGKPSINNITLSGNKSADELGIAEKTHSHVASDIGTFTQQSYDVVTNTYIDNSNGREITYSGWDSTGYIELTGDQLKCVWSTSSTWNAFYDESKQFISSTTFGAGGATVGIPKQARYVRLSNTSVAMRALEVYTPSSLTGMLDGISGRLKDIEDKESDWDSKAAGDHTHSYSILTDKPEIPSVSDWALQPSKPSYTASEVGALPDTTSGFMIPITYGVTTTTEIGNILSAGNTPYCLYNGNTYYYQDISYDNYYRFISITPGSSNASDPPIVKRLYKSIASADNTGWGSGTTTLYDTNHKPSWSDIQNKPAIPSAVTEATVSEWGFTKNTGTYVKPAGGIPANDLAESYAKMSDIPSPYDDSALSARVKTVEDTIDAFYADYISALEVL